MSFYLRTDYRLEDLFGELVKDIEANRTNKESNDDVYEPVTIIIPNRNVEYWLKQEIARKNKIAMNYRFGFFEDTIWKLLSLDNYVLIDHVFLTLVIYSILTDDSNTLGYSYFHDYIREDSELHHGKILNLSYELAQLFFRYYYNNEEIIKRFAEDTDDIQEPENVKKIFADQKTVFRKVKEKLAEINADYSSEAGDGETNLKFVFFFELLKALEGNSELMKLNGEFAGKTIYIFAFQFCNYHFLKLLKKLIENYGFHVYYYQLVLYDVTQNSGMDSVHNISRNNVELIHKVIGKEWIKKDRMRGERESDSEDDNSFLLERLQETYRKSGMSGIENHKEKKGRNDFSVTVIKAPHKKFEIKAIIRDIQENLIRNKDLRLNDIAILSPDLKEYFPLLKGYLEYLGIPYNIQDPKLFDVSFFASAVLKVAGIIDNLLQGKNIVFGLGEILEILDNPVFQSTFSISFEENLLFRKILHNLHIFFRSDTYPYHDWNVALRRLRAGKFLHDEVTLDIHGKEVRIVPYEDFEISKDIIEKFQASAGNLIDEIHELVDTFKKDLAKVPDATEKFYRGFSRIIQTYFDVSSYHDKYAIEKKSMQEFKKGMFYLRRLKIKPAGNFLTRFFEIVFENTYSKINEYLFEGITIASFMPLRPIPFQFVYVAGMNLEKFPGYDWDSPMDLTKLFLKKGSNEYNNILGRRDHNLFIFFEIFLSTRKKFTVSYVDYDLQNKRELYPSHVVKIFENFLENNRRNQNIIKIANSLKLKNSGVLIHKFEFQNMLLAEFREDLKKLRNLPLDFQNEYTYLPTHNVNTMSELYRDMKFSNKLIHLKIKNYRGYYVVPVKKFVLFLENPVLYFLEENNLSVQFDTYLEKVLKAEIPETENKYKLFDLLREIISRYVDDVNKCDKGSNDWRQIVEEIAMNDLVEGNLSVPANLKDILDHQVVDKLHEGEEKDEKKKHVKDIIDTLCNGNCEGYKIYYKRRIALNHTLNYNKEYDFCEEVIFPGEVLQLPAYDLKSVNNGYKYLFTGEEKLDILICVREKKNHCEIEKIVILNFWNFDFSSLFYLFTLANYAGRQKLEFYKEDGICLFKEDTSSISLLNKESEFRGFLTNIINRIHFVLEDSIARNGGWVRLSDVYSIKVEKDGGSRSKKKKEQDDTSGEKRSITYAKVKTEFEDRDFLAKSIRREYDLLYPENSQ